MQQYNVIIYGRLKKKYFFVNLLVFFYFIVIYYLFLNKHSNKNCLIKKEYFIQKIEIRPKRLEIHNVNKSGLKIKIYTYI
jgi:hypothetical protein